jgi:cell division septum initiation protein DivIVA
MPSMIDAGSTKEDEYSSILNRIAKRVHELEDENNRLNKRIDQLQDYISKAHDEVFSPKPVPNSPRSY